MSVLWLCGVTGVGKSTIGWQVWQHLQHGGVPSAFVDLDQIGFRPPTPGKHRIRARILADMWETFRDGGARSMVVVGPVDEPGDVEVYRAEFGALTLGRLHASRPELHGRVLMRRNGSGPRLAGNELAGQPVEVLREIADAAAAHAEALDRARVGDFRIDTDGLTVQQSADEIVSRMRLREPDQWPR